MAGELSFFSIGVGVVERGRDFYGGLLGWRLEEASGGLVVSGGGVAGGIHGGDAGASPYVFFRVDDLDAALARVEELGGAREPAAEDHGDEDQAARFGRFALCRDDQGSAFGSTSRPPPARPASPGGALRRATRPGARARGRGRRRRRASRPRACGRST